MNDNIQLLLTKTELHNSVAVSCKIDDFPGKTIISRRFSTFTLCRSSTTNIKTLKQDIRYILKRKSIDAYVVGLHSFTGIMSFILQKHHNREEEQFINNIISFLGKYYDNCESYKQEIMWKSI